MDSGPQGHKARALSSQFPHIQIPALTRDPWSRHEFLSTRVPKGSVLVGSSLGGLSALLLARDLGEGFLTGLVLIAPAVGFCDRNYRTPELLALVEDLVIPAYLPAHILAGLRDEVIPIQAIRDLVERSRTPAHHHLHELDDDHRLNGNIAQRIMISAVADLLSLSEE